MEINFVGTIPRGELPPEYPKDAQFIQKFDRPFWSGCFKIEGGDLKYFGIFGSWTYSAEHPARAFLATKQFLKIVDLRKPRALAQCVANSGYVKSGGVWRFNSSSIHARINRRAGLSVKIEG